MTNPTLERAARAVSEVMASAPAKAINNAEWIDFERKIARAVLMAVREPDEAMVNAWWSGLDDYYPDDGSIARGHTAMIDAILNDGEGE